MSCRDYFRGYHAELWAVCLCVSWAGAAVSPKAKNLPLPHSAYFAQETARISGQSLAGVSTLPEWRAHRDEYRRQLLETLGLWPMPERTDLKPVITGQLRHPEFTVEKVHFQASPGLYVTANLYLPKTAGKPVPAVLYVCGHARMTTNGVSLGNKTAYQHHGEWFARNGYVCLMIDTLQLGEIEGRHRGTYSEGQWVWNSRGYTPAGVEAWFGIRALDYLVSRPEVDRERIGMTGRSGGGSYTWTVAALDERVRVAAPIAGMTDLRNQVVDGAIEGHCDCMFFVNTYRWDFAQVAALIAPRPLLIGNSDKDTIFPLDGVIRLHEQARRIYQLYGAATNLGLLITEGPHADTQDLQVPVFRWMNRFLKGEQPLIEMAAVKLFPPEQLRVFDHLPEDQINTRIQDLFVPARQLAPDRGDLPAVARVLREKTFRGWPDDVPDVPFRKVNGEKSRDVRFEVYELETQPGINTRLWLLRPTRGKIARVDLAVLDETTWTNSPFAFLWLGPTPAGDDTARYDLASQKGRALAFFVPRGVDPADRPGTPKAMTHWRRRYMLLGQTLDSMRVWDIRCAVRALAALPELRAARVTLRASGTMGINTAYAGLFEPVDKLALTSLPASHNEGPDYLNVLKIWDIPDLLRLLPCEITSANP